MSYGHPNHAITSLRIISAALWSGIANISTHFVKYSVTASTHVLPWVDSRKGPRISVDSLSKGAPTGISPRGAWGFLGGCFTLAHSLHLETQLLQSSLIPLQ